MNVPELLNNRAEIRLRPVAERESAIIEYRVILMRMARAIRAEYVSTVLPEFKADRLVQDRATWFESMRLVARRAANRATNQLRELMARESVSHARRVTTSIRRAARIDLTPNMVTANIAAERRLAQQYIERNAGLIKSMSDDLIKGIEQAVYQATIDGQSPGTLSQALQKQFRIARNRADLIAVDQIASLNSDLNTTRMQQMGITQYRWQSRADNRVRPLHRAITGRVYKYGKPTDAENGLAPGKPIRCRCRDVPIIPATSANRSDPGVNTALNNPTVSPISQGFGFGSAISAGTGFLAGLFASTALDPEDDDSL